MFLKLGIWYGFANIYLSFKTIVVFFLRLAVFYCNFNIYSELTQEMNSSQIVKNGRIL